jgi:hypothetical protein
MTLDPRIQELLERYPLDLSAEELDELRAAAERDPRLDEIMDGLLEIDGELDGRRDQEAEPELSEAGRARLNALLAGVREAKGWSADGATPAARADEAKGWSADGATPAARADDAKGWSADGATPAAREKVVDLASVRRRRFSPPALLAMAALVAIGAGLALRTPPPTTHFVERGVPADLEGVLWVMGDARVRDGASRAVSEKVIFRAVLNAGSVSLVLLETQAGATHVLHPAPGGVWQGASGTNVLSRGGRPQNYRPARSGRAEYTLVAATTRPEIRAGAVASIDAFVAECDGRVLDRSAIEWTEEPVELK